MEKYNSLTTFYLVSRITNIIVCMKRCLNSVILHQVFHGESTLLPISNGNPRTTLIMGSSSFQV